MHQTGGHRCNCTLSVHEARRSTPVKIPQSQQSGVISVLRPHYHTGWKGSPGCDFVLASTSSLLLVSFKLVPICIVVMLCHTLQQRVFQFGRSCASANSCSTSQASHIRLFVAVLALCMSGVQDFVYVSRCVYSKGASFPASAPQV